MPQDGVQLSFDDLGFFSDSIDSNLLGFKGMIIKKANFLHNIISIHS